MGEEFVCRWLVTAGFEPDSPAERFTRTFVVTPEDWGSGDVPGQRLRSSRQQEATTYAARLMSDEALTWVRLDYRSPDGSATDVHTPGVDD